MLEKIKSYKKFKESYRRGLKENIRFFITIALLIYFIIESILYLIYFILKSIMDAIIEYERKRQQEEKEYKNSPAYFADTLANNSRRETQMMERISQRPVTIINKKYVKPDYSNNPGSGDFYKSLGNGTSRDFTKDKSPKW